MTSNDRAKPTRPTRPSGLGQAGGALWRKLTAELGFEHWETPILAAACRQADQNAALEQVLAKAEDDGLMVDGSNGQPKLHPAFAELRLGRQALARLLGQLCLPADSGDGTEAPKTAKQRQASKAAQHRWGNVRRLREGQADGL